MDQNPNAQQQEQQPVVVVVEPDNPTPPGSTAGDAAGGPPPAQMVVNSNNSSNELPLAPPPTPAAVLNTASADVQDNGPSPTPSMFSNSSNEMPQQVTIADGGSSDGSSLELLGVSEQFTTSSSTTTSGSSSLAASWLDFFAQNSTTNSELSTNMTTTTLLNVDDGGNSSSTPTSLIEKINDYENYDKMEGSADKWAAAAAVNECRWSDDKQNFGNAWSGFFLGAAFANVLILFILLIITRGKRGYFGARLYTLNLAVFAIVQILILAWAQPDDCFGIAKMASISVHGFFIKYNAQLLEWSQIVFLSSTTVLVLDCIHRSVL
uniref:G_PROTEIN_RECEP_F2_4 domain-containing protein n=1 Tax=Globodera pallida TaxID=36090 RepID=A0A183CD54_GLOPA